MIILKKTKILTGLGMIILLLLSFGLYGMQKARSFLNGPGITIEWPKNGQEIKNSFIKIIGQSNNIANLFLNGRQITTDKDGRFKDDLLLAEGYNIIEISGIDKFGRIVKEKLELVFNKQTVITQP